MAMKKSEILEILNDWNFWKKDLDTGVGRTGFLKEIERLSQMNEIVVISGVRRSGKSTLLLQFCESLIKKGTRKKDILIINLEDPRFRDLNLELLNQVYEIYLTELAPGKNHYVVLDEVQVIPGWEKFARFLYENKKVHVFVTGSSSKLLASEYSTTLAGRHVDIEIFPLSFVEFLGFKGTEIKNNLDAVEQRHALKRGVKEFLEFGGFPKVTLLQNERDKNELLTSYFRDITIKDVVKRYRIKEVGKLEELAKYYLTNVSCVQSFNKTKNIIGLSLDTVERFSHYLENAYFVYFVRKFSFKTKEQILNPRKIYCIDLGLRNAVSFQFKEEMGRLAENIAFIELKRRKKDIFYWKDKQQREVDFVVREGKKIKQLVQVCWNIDDEKTREREIHALLSAMELFKLKEGLVITEDKEEEESIKGQKIRFVPLWKWLLSEAKATYERQ